MHVAHTRCKHIPSALQSTRAGLARCVCSVYRQRDGRFCSWPFLKKWVGGWLKKLVHVNGGVEAHGVRKNATPATEGNGRPRRKRRRSCSRCPPRRSARRSARRREYSQRGAPRTHDSAGETPPARQNTRERWVGHSLSVLPCMVFVVESRTVKRTPPPHRCRYPRARLQRWSGPPGVRPPKRSGARPPKRSAGAAHRRLRVASPWPYQQRRQERESQDESLAAWEAG